jgi:Spy/CpxP family protein refolding chaperone
MGEGHMGEGRTGHGHERPFGGGPWAHSAPDHDGGAFGVRRPLRFLSRNLDLSEEQVTDLARILGHLKTERAQAEVDQQRSVGAFAEALEAESLDEGKLTEGIAVREASQERVRAAVRKALLGIHALLSKEQRSKFAYLLRTGALSI